MPHFPKPFFRKSRGLWYVQIDGRQHNLGADKDQAFAKYHELMGQPREQPCEVSSDLLVSLIDTFLGWTKSHRAPDTYEWYRYRLELFARRYPQLTTDELRPFHVQEWLDSLGHLASGSRRNYCRAIKRCMRWALTLGYIDSNPIAHMEQPKAGKRELVITPDEFERMLSMTPSREFRDLLITTWDTGCRPQESLRVEARHVDLVNQRWVFPASEAKGEAFPRIVYLAGRALEITKRLVLQYPEGKLFRNSKRVAWTTAAVNCAFIRAQVKLGRTLMKERGGEISEEQVAEFIKSLSPHHTVRGEKKPKTKVELRVEAKQKLINRAACRLAPKYSLYAIRHSWATHALGRGVDSLTVAILMGHQDPSTLAKVYQHLGHNPQFLLEQAKRAAG